MTRPISDLFRHVGPDHRWAGPTHECLCGSSLFLLLASFHENKVGMYFLEMMCANCGALLIAPTEIDQPRPEPGEC